MARGAYEKDGRRHAMGKGKASKYMGYKSLREEQNLAVKSGRDVFVTDSPCTRKG